MKFKVTLDDGSKFMVTTQEEQEETVGTFGKVPVSKFERGERNVVGNIFERPGAAVREGLRSIKDDGFVKGFKRGSVNPGVSETFQEEGAKKASDIASRLPRSLVKPVAFAGSVGAQSLGFGMDIATNPTDLLLAILGQTSQAKQGASILANTKAGKSVGRFLSKERSLPGKGLLKKGIRFTRKLKGDPKAPIKETISDQIRVTKQSRSEAIRKVKSKTDKKLLRSANKIDDEILKMTDDLQRSAETGSLEFQKRIPKAQRAASNEYGIRLDNIADDLVKKGEVINKGDMNSVLTATKDELRELEFPLGRAESVIDKLIDTKYSFKQPPVRILNTRKSISAKKSFGVQELDLREVLSDTKLIKGQASSGVKLGTKPFSDDEVAIAIFNNNFGKLLEQKASALIELNKSYAPVIRVNKAAHRLFKPRAGELQTKSGTGLLKRAATKKIVKGNISGAPTIERGERQLLNILEEGTEFGKGVGKISEPTKKIGDKIAGLEISKIKSKEAITKSGNLKKQRIIIDFDKRLNQLAGREKKVEQLLRNKAKIKKIRILVAEGTIAVGVAIGIIKGFLGLKKSSSRSLL